MERYREAPREIPVIGRYDVVVCGGGAAGFIAATAAALCAARSLAPRRTPVEELRAALRQGGTVLE